MESEKEETNPWLGRRINGPCCYWEHWCPKCDAMWYANGPYSTCPKCGESTQSNTNIAD